MQLSLRFLGSFQVLVDGVLAVFATDRARALLVYLAVEADRPHERGFLAGLLWPDHSEASARQSLSQTLVRLRRAIRDYDAQNPFLRITSQTIQLDMTHCQLDVCQFNTLLDDAGDEGCTEGLDMDRSADGREARAAEQLITESGHLQRLEQAVRLYRGDFLKGLFLSDSQAFEEWVLLTREQLRQKSLEALSTLSEAMIVLGRYEQARQYTARQLEIEPWREPAYRQLIHALALAGDRSGALIQYRLCRQVLADELGIEPEPATTELYEAIRSGRVEPPVSRLPPSLLAGF